MRTTRGSPRGAAGDGSSAPGAENAAGEPLPELLAIAADWVWEQDSAHCLTRLQGQDVEGSGEERAEPYLGKPRWQIGLELLEGDWEAHRAALEARQPFRELVLYRTQADGSRHYVSVSGVPVFAAGGQFLGYRGVGRNVDDTQHHREEHLRFRAAMDASPDTIFVADAAEQRLLYVNETACRVTEYSRKEILQLPPAAILRISPEQVSQLYAALIARGDEGLTTEPRIFTSRDGSRKGWWEAHWRAVRIDGRWVIVTTAREATQRVLAERATLRAKRMYAALSATNEALLRAATPDELYQQVCDAAVDAGEFLAAALLLPERVGSAVTVAASAGEHIQMLERAQISLDPASPHGQGLVGHAYREGELLVSDDFLADARTRPWHEAAAHAGVKAAAAVPLLRAGTATGILLLYSSDKRGFDEETVALLQRLSRNVTFALDSMEGETARARAEAALRASEEKYRAILENIEEAYYEVDLRGDLTFVNSAFTQLLGYTEAELIGMNNRTFMRPEIARKVFETFNEVYRSALPVRAFDWEMVRKNGELCLGEGSIRLIEDAEGRPAGFRGILRDVTERRREEALLAMEHDVTQVLAAGGSAEQALRDVTRIIGRSKGWPTGGFFRLGEAGRSLSPLTAWSEGASADDSRAFCDAALAAAAQGALAPACAGQRPVVTALPAPTADVSRHLFAFPVLAAELPLGVFSFACGDAREPEPRLVETLAVIGNQVGQFLQRKDAEQGLRASEARFRSLTELSSDWYWEQDSECRFSRLEGRHTVDGQSLEGEHCIGRARWETGLEIETGDWESHRALLAARRPFKDFVLRRRLADGSVCYISVSGEPVYDADGLFGGYRGIGRDITDRKQAADRIQYLATHDSLTDLPNRALFSQMLNLAIQTAQRYQRPFALMFIDLDRFKLVNDTLGHEAGDVLLKQVGERLRRAVRASDIIARLGGDEFVVLLQEIHRNEEAAVVARKILAVATEPMIIREQEFRVTASIGISLYPAHGEDEQTLMKHADMAMYLAKEEGKNNFQFYSPDIKSQSFERLALESSLRSALERDEFTLHYQSKLDLKTGQISGVEALLRWNHPTLGLVPPNQFIPIAEETGLIVPIGRWVLRSACEQNMAWQRQGLPSVTVAVNLSPRQFSDDNLLQDIKQALGRAGMPGHLLELELTETMVMQNPLRAVATLKSLKELGIRIAMDDFGVGYSSLAQLKGFPVDILKVDRSFIRNLPESQRDRAITEAIIAMAKNLSLMVVAEGVETAEQEAFLRDISCDESQGFFFSKPIPPDEFALLLRKNNIGP